MVQLTPTAITKVKEILSQQTPEPAGLRVAVVGGGCSGFSYHMAFENQVNKDADNVYEFQGLKVLVDGPLGELDHMVLLQQYIGKDAARDLSPHWRGSHFRIYENKKRKLDVLVYRSVWSDDASAQRYYALYEQILKGKWKSTEVTSRSDTRIDGKGDDGYFCVDLSATVVTSREGLAAPCDK